MCGCATHSPELLHSLLIEDFLRRLGEALRKRVGPPLTEIIYDAVMEALDQIRSEPDIEFEAPFVQEAMECLYQQDSSQSMQLTARQGQEVADAYNDVLESRALELAGRWLEVSAKRHSHEPDLAPCCLSGLVEALGNDSEASDLSATNQGICTDLRSQRTIAAISRLAAAGGDDSQRRDFGYRLACFAVGARWALAKADFVRQHGRLFSTIDVYDGSHRYLHRGVDIPNGSTSQAILSAFEQQVDTPAEEIARRWIECFEVYQLGCVGANTIVVSCVSFQHALGLVDQAGIDYCHENQIAEGLRRVLLSPRAAQIVAALPAGACHAVKPKSCFITPEPAEQALQIRDLILGVIWGLAAVPEPSADWVG